MYIVIVYPINLIYSSQISTRFFTIRLDLRNARSGFELKYII